MAPRASTGRGVAQEAARGLLDSRAGWPAQGRAGPLRGGGRASHRAKRAQLARQHAHDADRGRRVHARGEALQREQSTWQRRRAQGAADRVHTGGCVGASRTHAALAVHEELLLALEVHASEVDCEPLARATPHRQPPQLRAVGKPRVRAISSHG